MKLALIKETVMKRILVVTLFMVLVLSGCKNNSEIVGDSMSKIENQQKPFIFLNSLSVFRIDNIYKVVIEENGVIQKTVEFSPDRKSHNAQGLTLIKNEDISLYLDMSIDELKQKLGEIHADVGSGFYIPAYITEDGFLVCLDLENDIVYEVIKRDILTNMVVERVSN